MSRTIRSKHTFSTSNNYHDDSWESMKHAPKWYRKCLNSKLRTAQNNIVRSFTNYNDFDNVALPVFVKDDAWFW